MVINSSAPPIDRLMARYRMLMVLLLLGGVLAAHTVQAQQGRFVIEILVFQDIAYAPDEPQPSVAPQPRFYTSAIGFVSARPGSPVAGALVERLPETALHLSGALAVLSGTNAYQPLMHIGWRQAAYDREAPQYVGVGDANSGPVYGTISLQRGRYLHIDTDLVFDSGVTRHRLRTSRKIQLGELNYFDHPAFGLLVRVARE